MRRILISGGNGLVGSSLGAFFIQRGDDVHFLKRDPLTNDPRVDGGFERFDVMIHLAGSSIAKRWTRKNVKEIEKSRIDMTQKVVERILSLEYPPKVFISASAVGYYGDTGLLIKDERAESSNSGFLPRLCKLWEAASAPLKSRGIRLVHCRFGVVLSKEGGMLKKILPLYKWGVGGVLGSGKQYISWIGLEDLLGAVEHIISHEEIVGAVNVVSPFPVTNREFTQTFTQILKRPIGLPIPSIFIKGFFGEMGKELLLASNRIAPKKLLESGFQFHYPTLSSLLKQIL